VNPEQMTRIRIKLEMSREKFARMLNVSASAVVKWERGERPISEMMGDYILLKEKELNSIQQR